MNIQQTPIIPSYRLPFHVYMDQFPYFFLEKSTDLLIDDNNWYSRFHTLLFPLEHPRAIVVSPLVMFK